MRNILFKFGLLISVFILSLSVFSYVNANYGDSTYGSNQYSVTPTVTSTTATSSTSGGITKEARDKFLVDQQSLLLAQQGSTVPSTTTSSGSVITRTLKLKMTHNDVKLLQQYLNTHGYTVSKTGVGSKGHESTYFGTKTKQAVMKFQKAHKLKADGVVGPKTRILMK